jgi:hypothetical protein
VLGIGVDQASARSRQRDQPPASRGVHWMRNALAHVPKGQHTMVAAAIRQAFLQTDADAAHQTWGHMSPTSCGAAGPSSPR